MNETIELITKIALLLSSLITIVKLSFDYISQRKSDLTNLNLESYSFLLDSIKEFFIEGQRRAFFYKHIGIDASSNDQILISELDSKLNHKFSWYRLKIASQYFKYNETNITIKLRTIDKVGEVFFIIFSIYLMVVGSTPFILNKFSSSPEKSFVPALITFIISIMFGAFFINKFVAPVNVAHAIQKQLKASESQANN